MSARGVVSLGIVGAVLAVLAGCGRCDGAVRSLDGSSTDFPGSLVFTVWGDGPGSVTSDELRAQSGIDETTFVVEGPDGVVEDASVTGDWGGHTCLNGVNFGVVLEDPAPGAYEAVLWLDALAWPFRGDKDELEVRDGQSVLVSEVTVE